MSVTRRQKVTATLLTLSLLLVLLGSVRTGELLIEPAGELSINSTAGAGSCCSASETTDSCCTSEPDPEPVRVDSCCATDGTSDVIQTPTTCCCDGLDGCPHCTCTSSPAFSLTLIDGPSHLWLAAIQPSATLFPVNHRLPAAIDGEGMDHIPIAS